MPEILPEPWLRGVLPGVDPAIGHLLRASEQIREDMARALEALNAEQIWATPDGMTSAGFHAKHLAGSTDRLCTYLKGEQLDVRQIAQMSAEGVGCESGGELMAAIDRTLDQYDSLIRELRQEDFGSLREVGRQRLQVTAIGLAIHIAEHGQRHTGQAIGASKLVGARVA